MPDLTPHHRFSLQTRAGALQLDLAATLTAPWTVLFGPSGSGKSTLLRALCGILNTRRTSLTFDRYKQGTWTPLASLPPNHRGVSYAPQGGAVFPHLNVIDNIRFPSNVCTEPASQATLIDDALTLFRLHVLQERHPAQLSGGERQRVALARAFARPDTCLMLLDEPFTGLDRKLRDELLPAMQSALAVQNIPCLSVTHDVDEALQLNAEVLRLEDGKLIAQGPARDILAEDRQRLLNVLA